MAATFNKPFLTLAQQIALLKQRGLQFADEASAEGCLRRNGYYRLSAYWYPFRTIVPLLDAQGNQLLDSRGKGMIKRSDSFLPNSQFEDAQALYIFDKRLKLLLMDAIERVEIAVRAEIALCLGSKDIFAHTSSRFFRPEFKRPDRRDPLQRTKHQQWLDKFEDAVFRSRDVFVIHYEERYGTRFPLPIWMAIELWDFGRLSQFYSGMDTPYRVAVASRFSVPHRDLLESWLRSLNYIRNTIAHHGRLWNLHLVILPVLPRLGQISEFDALTPIHNANTRIYGICCILSYFSRIVNPQSSWPRELAELARQFPQMPYAGIGDMGFPANWESHSFWK